MLIVIEDRHCVAHSGIDRIKEYLQLDDPDAWRSEKFQKGLWDGKKYFISAGGKFQHGFLPLIIKKFNPKIIDHRTFSLTPKFKVRNLSANIRLFDHQYEILLKLIGKFYGDLYFPRGICDAATNAGKTFIMAALIKAFDTPKTLILIHSDDIYKELVKFFSTLFEVTVISKKEIKFGHIMIMKYKTLNNRVKQVNYKKYLKSVELLICDESHRTGSKDYRSLISKIPCFSTYFFSGTPLERESAIENMYMVGMSGPILASIKNIDLINNGTSMIPIVQLYKSTDRYPKSDYRTEVKQYIELSPFRLKVIIEKTREGQVLIPVRATEHGKYLLEKLQEAHPNRIIRFLEGTSDFRDEMIQDLRENKIDVMITTILREGVNAPYLNRLINGMGGKSIIEIKQLAGRLLRRDGKNTHVEIVDFIDMGKITRTHSRARIKLYQKEQFEIQQAL